MRLGVIIQARMGSTRLPGKVMKKICNKSVLTHLIERVKLCDLVDDIIVATTVNIEDDVIQNEALKNSVKFFRGSEQDVLSRYYYAAKENNLDVIVRVTSDCPLFDPNLLGWAIKEFASLKYDVVRVGVSGGFPRGLDAEVLSMKLLEEAYNKANEEYYREHVTPYIYDNYSNILSIKSSQDYSKYRITLDTEEDFLVIYNIFNGINKDKFYYQDIIKFLNENPEIAQINSHIEQKR